MKTLVKVIITMLVVLAFTQSCKKCTSCNYTYKSPSTQKDTTESFGEACGTPSDIDNYEKSCDQSARQYGAECRCSS